MRSRALAAALLTPVLLAPLAGCAQSVDPIERLSKKAALRVHPPGPTVTTHRRWGPSAPLAPAPAPPARHAAHPGLPRVIDRIPTRDRVVFLTYAVPGGTPSPRFLTMARELRLPVTACAGDCGVKTLIPWKNVHHLTPGAVVRTDPNTPPALLRTIQREGFTVARLEDYLQ